MVSSPKISFIMPAKNEAAFISDSIDAIINSIETNWELIVIDDHSTDGTFQIVKEYQKVYSNIRVEINNGNGKVEGLNYGYQLASGRIIKCIDADDLIDPGLFLYLNEDILVSCHDYYIVTSDLRKTGISRINPVFLNSSFLFCLENLLSIPRCSWSLSREIADKVFPIPTELPFEDIWFSLAIKRVARQIEYIPKPLYHYRQHENQTYGGMLNFSKKIVIFRAERMIKVISYLKSGQRNLLMEGLENRSLFNEIEKFYQILLKDKISIRQIVSSGLRMEYVLKAIAYKKLSKITPLLQRFLWAIRSRLKAN